MSRVYLGLGSNVDSRKHIAAALDALTESFGSLKISTVYESESVGFTGSLFLNLVVGIKTTLSLKELSIYLKKVEDNNDRCRTGPKFSPRTLDIDILTYKNYAGLNQGIDLPRDEVLQNAFVLLPLSELAPNGVHTQLHKTYGELWSTYNKVEQKLWPVSFIWQGRELSKTLK